MSKKFSSLGYLILFYSSTLIAQVNINNGLVAFYPFSGNANDVSGNNHHATVMNGAYLVNDRFGNSNSAYFFDGVDDFLRVADNGSFSTPHMSISLWFKTNSDNLQNLVGKRKFDNDGTQGGGAQYQFFINYPPFPGIGSNLVGSNNTCSFIANSSYINTGTVICKNRWYHAVITYDGSTHKIYIDGVLKLSANTSFSAMLNCASELRFGNWWAGGTLSFSGVMDDIRWYNRALNQAEVTTLFGDFITPSSSDFSFSQDICNPRTVQFRNLTPGSVSAFWDFGNNTTNSSSQNPVVNYGSFGTYTVKLRVQNVAGCIDSVAKTIPIEVLSSTLITTPDTSVCRGSSLQLNTISGLKSCWSGASGLPNPSAEDPFVTPTDSTVYSVIKLMSSGNLIVNGDFSDGINGFASDYLPQTQNTSAGAYWVGNNPASWNAVFPFCPQQSSSGGNMLMINGNNVVGAKLWQQSVTILPNTNYGFSFMVRSLSVQNPAQLRFSINGLLLPDPVQASPTTCDWRSYYVTWNSGNNTLATLAIVNVNSQLIGNDFAIDDISFAQVFLRQDSVKITVTDQPQIALAAPVNSICRGDSVALSAAGAANLSWSPAAGLSNTTGSFTTAAPQVTTKYLVEGFDLPGCVGRDSVTITVLPGPQLTVSPNTAICEGTSTIITATSPDAIQFSWSPATGLTSTAAHNPAASPPSSTTYVIEVTGANSCTSIDSVAVTVLAVPTVDTRSDTTLCEGTGTILYTTSTGATSFTWTPTTGLNNPNAASPIASPAVDTKYMITASNGACEVRDSLIITVMDAPVLTRSADTTICGGGQAQLLASGGLSYSWSPATYLNNPNIPNPVSTANAPIRYFVTATGANGCTRTDSVNIGWMPKPVFAISPASPAVCAGDSILLTASGADNYNWYEGANVLNPGSAGTIVQPPNTQPYSVAVEHIACRLTDSLHVMVNVRSRPVVSIAKSNDIDCSNGSATLSASGGVNYLWTPAANLSGANNAVAIVTPATSTTYSVRVSDANGCSTTDSIRVNVRFDPSTGSYNMPDAFTPNNDGLNDCFGLRYWGVLESLNFAVFNRWGERIFFSNNASLCWDGTYKGVPQPAGTYVYQISAKTACGPVFKKGTVVLIR